MKKIFLLLLLLCILPISVFAKANTKETVLEAIQSIENVQVEEDLLITKLTVTDNIISMELLNNNILETKEIPYDFNDTTFTFSTGIFTKNYNNNSVEEITNNKPAFYLYSILESMSTSPYEEEHYYNELWIKEKIKNLVKKDLTIDDSNWGKTFGLTIEQKTLQNNIGTYQVSYHYYLDGEDPILLNIEEIDPKVGFTNPNTGTFETFVFITLLIVIGLAGLTYWNPKKS